MATSKDVEELIKYIKQKVYEKFGKEIETEIEIISLKGRYKMKGITLAKIKFENEEMDVFNINRNNTYMLWNI